MLKLSKIIKLFAKEMKFSIKDFFSKCDQIRSLQFALTYELTSHEWLHHDWLCSYNKFQENRRMTTTGFDPTIT